MGEISMIARTKLSIDHLSLFLAVFIRGNFCNLAIKLLFIFRPPRLWVHLIRVNSTNWFEKLIHLIQFMGIVKWVCQLIRKNKIISAIIVCRIPVVSHHLYTIFRSNLLIFLKHSLPLFLSICVIFAEFIFKFFRC